MSDAFLVTLVGPSGHTTVTSSAVQILSCSDSTVSGYFRLSYGGQVSSDIPHDVSGAALQTVLSLMHEQQLDGVPAVEVNREEEESGNYQWKITFVDHLDLWSKHPLMVLPGSDNFNAVSDLLTVQKAAFSGRYPVKFTLWEKGTYDLSVFSGDILVSGSSYTIQVTNGPPQASSSFAYGLGLQTGMAGEQSSFEVQVKDSHQPEIQSIVASGTVIDFVNEIQRLEVVSSYGSTFQLDFRGQETANIEVGVSTLQQVKDALEALTSIGEIAVTSNGASVIEAGDIITIEFLSEHGSLDLMKSSGPDIVTKLQEGEAPYRSERQSFHCDADVGYVILAFEGNTATLDFDDDIATVEVKLSALVGSAVSIVEVDASVPRVCDPLGKHFFVDFPVVLGDVAAIAINFDSLQNGSITIHGNGEGEHGAVNGISPIMGHFTLSHKGAFTHPISVDASAEDIKTALESLSSIGSVSVTKDLIGIRRDDSGQNLVPGMTSLVSIWSVTFASKTEDGCQPGSWDKCPSNIGDIPTLEIDTSLVLFDIGATQQQTAPTIKVIEVRKGSSGNFIEETDQVEINFSLVHDVDSTVGIGVEAVHELTCSYSPEAISAENRARFDWFCLDHRELLWHCLQVRSQ
jgi:hypothetical protein